MKEKLFALLVVSLLYAWALSAYDRHVLHQIATLPAAAFIDHARSLHSHHYVTHVVSLSIFGGVYLGIVELLARGFRTLFRKSAVAQQPE